MAQSAANWRNWRGSEGFHEGSPQPLVCCLASWERTRSLVSLSRDGSHGQVSLGRPLLSLLCNPLQCRSSQQVCRHSVFRAKLLFSLFHTPPPSPLQVFLRMVKWKVIGLALCILMFVPSVSLTIVDYTDMSPRAKSHHWFCCCVYTVLFDFAGSSLRCSWLMNFIHQDTAQKEELPHFHRDQYLVLNQWMWDWIGQKFVRLNWPECVCLFPFWTESNPFFMPSKEKPNCFETSTVIFWSVQPQWKSEDSSALLCVRVCVCVCDAED